MDGFENFVRARSAALARCAYLLTGNVHLAEDLLQDTLARVAERWRSIERAGDPEPYVRRVLYTRAVDGWRRRRRVEALHRLGAGHRPELVTDDAETVTRRLVLHDALARLTVRQRAVLVLRFYEDLPDDEIAAVLGCSPSTVRSNAARGLAKLRAGLPTSDEEL